MGDFVDSFFSSSPPRHGSERRKEIRSELLQFVEVRFDEEMFGQATTMDISSMGLRVRSDKPIEPGACVFLMFNLPDAVEGQSKIQGEYIVQHCDIMDGGWKIGLRIYSMLPASRTIIKEFLERDG